MSNPSFSNIDLWLFELAEGNLSPSQVEQLKLFLLQHPEFDVDKDVWEMTRMKPAQHVYPNQEGLEKKKPVAWYAVGTTTVAVMALLIWSSFNNGTNLEGGFTVAAEASLVEDGGSGSNFSSDNEFEEEITAGHSELDLQRTNNNTSINNSSLPNNRNVIEGENESVTRSLASNGVHSMGNGVLSTGNSELTEPAFGSMANSESPLVNGIQVNSISGIESDMVHDLIPMSIQLFEVLDDEDQLISENSISNGSGFGIASQDYHVSFKAKLNGFKRKIQRMMDNPVALKNFRDPHYHVPGMLPNDINISSNGTMLAPRVQTNTRLQWLGQENEQMMNQLSIDGYAYSIRGGVGLQVYHSLYKNGMMSVASAAFTYSPKLSISKSISLEPSLRFKTGNTSLASSKINGTNQVELERGNSRSFYQNSDGPLGNDLWYHDLGVGLMVNTEWFFAGAQVDNLFRHKDNVYENDVDNPRRADYHFIATIGTDWVSRKENLGLSPYLVYQKNENLSEAWLGANFRCNWFTLGAGISSNFEPAASIGLKFDHFALNYNADYVESDMTGKKALSHQLTLRFVGKPSRFGKRLLNL